MYPCKPFIEPELDLSKYSDQLKHENWKIKRNEILIRDNYECQLCFSDDILQVHHKSYLKNHLAWEYPNNYLITLCQKCHELFETDKLSNGRQQPEFNGKRIKESSFYKKIYSSNLTEQERNIINYISKNTNHKNEIKIDAEIIHTNQRSVFSALQTLIKLKLIEPTYKPSVYIYNQLYFG